MNALNTDLFFQEAPFLNPFFESEESRFSPLSEENDLQ